LRGKVLEIGGVKEKVLAAYRSGLREVIMPKSNEKDLREVPDEVRKNMSFMFVDRMDEVLKLALLRPADEELADHAETPPVMLPPALPADRVAPVTETSIASD
jgi:ATP-dependent Lon protease